MSQPAQPHYVWRSLRRMGRQLAAMAVIIAFVFVIAYLWIVVLGHGE